MELAQVKAPPTGSLNCLLVGEASRSFPDAAVLLEVALLWCIVGRERWGCRGQTEALITLKQTTSNTVESKEKGLCCKRESFNSANKQSYQLSGEL